jgi:hypothetical protein
MKYVLLADLKDAEEYDDGLFAIKTRLTEDDDAEEATVEIFSEGDLYKIRTRRPHDADAIALKDDWKFFNSRTNALLGYVFGD